MNQADLRVVRSKKLIREAFIDLIEEKGYKNITIKDIAKRAMVNRKTFYNHYDSIDALFADILRTTMDLLLEDLRFKDLGTNYPSSSEDLYTEIRILLHNLSNNKRRLNIFFNDVSSYELTKQLGEQILQNIFDKVATLHQQKKASNLPIELLSTSITAVFIAVIKWYMKNVDTYSEEDTTKIFLALISKELFWQN